MAYPTEIDNLVSVSALDSLAAAGHAARHNELKTAFDAVKTYLTVTTKGDILAATGSQALTRLGVGTNDQVLVADSSEATGLKWASSTSVVNNSEAIIAVQVFS